DPGANGTAERFVSVLIGVSSSHVQQGQHRVSSKRARLSPYVPICVVETARSRHRGARQRTPDGAHYRGHCNAKQQLPDASVILTEKQPIGALHAMPRADGGNDVECARGMDFAESPNSN
ncbi:MAG TPA: hypothetical protein VFO53_02995, partial [Casimicrobiaceae bacterium]|nr:hypothetical protein [Casimicrobiaceae bacterium]